MNLPTVSTRVDAILCWMSEKPLDRTVPYVVMHTSRQSQGFVTDLVPTIYDYAGLDPAKWNGPVPMTGKSLKPVLTGPQKGTSTHCVPAASCHVLNAPQTPTPSNACESAQMSGVVCRVVR